MAKNKEVMAQTRIRVEKLQTLKRATTPLARNGTLNGLYGTLNGLYGTLDGLYGTLNGLYGTLNGLYGTVCTVRTERFPFLERFARNGRRSPHAL